jgi:hypothetical protein
LTSDLDFSNFNGKNVKTLTFNSEVSTTGTGAQTIDWSAGQKHVFTFGAGTATFSFTAPNGPCSLTLRIVQDGTGGRTASWPGTVKWSGGSAPVLSTAASAVDIITFYYNGTNYYGVGSFAFA